MYSALRSLGGPLRIVPLVSRGRLAILQAVTPGMRENKCVQLGIVLRYFPLRRHRIAEWFRAQVRWGLLAFPSFACWLNDSVLGVGAAVDSGTPA